MKEGSEPGARVDPDAYTEEYFRRGVEGHEEFAASGGRVLSPRLQRALTLAGLRASDRVLDIACGRGEVVLHGALRGAYAVGIDYAAAALNVARESLGGPGGGEMRTALALMDAGRLAFRPGTFDVALMLDFVEHVYQPELERAFAEVRQALKPGGRLIIHTSPNRVFEEVVYPRYVRNVHRVALGLGRRFKLDERFFNELVLPTAATPPHDEYERRLHVNPQSAGTLRAALARAGFAVRKVDHWEPPADAFFDETMRWHNIGLKALDAVRFLRPLSRVAPLHR
ncbi:MAG: class I SAM-dependent methyltransferase, partial [Dehalococcoidia bacterium]|nr:class I SAM-dependent methyltransferase [Dehalococcoidia bacterium]